MLHTRPHVTQYLILNIRRHSTIKERRLRVGSHKDRVKMARKPARKRQSPRKARLIIPSRRNRHHDVSYGHLAFPVVTQSMFCRRASDTPSLRDFDDNSALPHLIDLNQ